MKKLTEPEFMRKLADNGKTGRITMKRVRSLYRLYCLIADRAGALRLPKDFCFIDKIPEYGLVSRSKTLRDLKRLCETQILVGIGNVLFELKR